MPAKRHQTNNKKKLNKRSEKNRNPGKELAGGQARRTDGLTKREGEKEHLLRYLGLLRRQTSNDSKSRLYTHTNRAENDY